MLNIGDFARFAGVSVRMLRHYDALGLLVPTHVDPASGYRRYDPALLARADRLVALKELGFTLEQVGDLLDDRLTAQQMKDLLHDRRDALHAQIEADRDRLAEVEHRLRLLEGKTVSITEYTEKSLPAVTLAQLSGHVDDVAEVDGLVGPMYARLGAALDAAGITPDAPGIAWYAARDDGMDFAVGEQVAEPVDGLEHTTLPAADRAITAVHRGTIADLHLSWQELSRHVAEAGHTFAGPCREVYHQVDTPEGDGWVTEIQQPIA
ncbi:MerR family transcriptional regulator [Brevibacterium litoralis]|uniref:MerR family transcriptional regulator n=1 Tax=Brevibacterium litoralis TaxID=3138935 RepID=UPI0032ED26EC